MTEEVVHDDGRFSTENRVEAEAASVSASKDFRERRRTFAVGDEEDLELHLVREKKRRSLNFDEPSSLCLRRVRVIG